MTQTDLAAPVAPEKLAWLSLVVLEHAHGQGCAYTPPAGAGPLHGPEPCDPARYGSALMELHVRATAAALKARNASTVALVYNQATGALPFYASSRPLAQAAHPEWRLPTSSCGKFGDAASGDAASGAAAPLGADTLPNYAAYVWDHTKTGVTQAQTRALARRCAARPRGRRARNARAATHYAASATTIVPAWSLNLQQAQHSLAGQSRLTAARSAASERKAGCPSALKERNGRSSVA